MQRADASFKARAGCQRAAPYFCSSPGRSGLFIGKIVPGAAVLLPWKGCWAWRWDEETVLNTMQEAPPARRAPWVKVRWLPSL